MYTIACQEKTQTSFYIRKKVDSSQRKRTVNSWIEEDNRNPFYIINIRITKQ